MTTIDNATLDKLLEGVNPSDPQSMFSDAGLFGQLKKALAERMLQAEPNHNQRRTKALERRAGQGRCSNGRVATGRGQRHVEFMGYGGSP
jgi:hypothetical protein